MDPVWSHVDGVAVAKAILEDTTAYPVTSLKNRYSDSMLGKYVGTAQAG